MKNYINFEVDEIRFPTLKAFMKDLKDHNERGVFILDAGIGVEDNTWYSIFKEQGIFIKST